MPHCGQLPQDVSGRKTASSWQLGAAPGPQDLAGVSPGGSMQMAEVIADKASRVQGERVQEAQCRPQKFLG
jgi:hypothetical protein